MPDDDGRVHSERLGLTLWLEDGRLQALDTATAQRLLGSAEMRTAAAQANQRMAAMEAEIARLRAELARHRPGGG